MAPKRKKVHHPPVAAQRPGHPFVLFLQAIPGIFHRNQEGGFFALGVTHLFFFLVFLASIATFVNPYASQPFGGNSGVVEQEKAQPAPQEKTRAVSLAGTAVYGAFTLLTWLALVARRRAISGRVVRLLSLMLIPGTIVVAYLLFHIFRS